MCYSQIQYYISTAECWIKTANSQASTLGQLHYQENQLKSHNQSLAVYTQLVGQTVAMTSPNSIRSGVGIQWPPDHMGWSRTRKTNYITGSLTPHFILLIIATQPQMACHTLYSLFILRKPCSQWRAKFSWSEQTIAVGNFCITVFPDSFLHQQIFQH